MSLTSKARALYDQNISFVGFTIKAVVGALLIILTSRHFGYIEEFWCLISFLLVLTPDSAGAVTLAVTRMKANLCGAAGAMTALCFEQSYLYTVCIALACTAVFCRMARAFDSARVALAGAIIVLSHAPGVHVWDNALQRIIAVTLGCALGLVMTLLFHRKLPDTEGFAELAPLTKEQRERIMQEIHKHLGRRG